MKQNFSRLLFACLLGIIGLVLVVFYSMTIVAPSGNEVALIGRYLSSGFHVAPLIGGLGMIVVSLFVLLTLRSQVGCGHDHDHEHDHEHNHDHGELNPVVALLIICLPLTVALTHTKHELSADGASKLSEANPDPRSVNGGGYRYPEFTLETLDEYKSKNANGAYIMGVRELFGIAGDPSISKVVEGLSVEVSGAVRNQPKDPENPLVKRMYRMFMTCCAADMQAIPIALHLSEEVAAGFEHPEHAWLKVEGDITFETDSQGIKRTIIKVRSAVPSVPPDNEYLQGGAGMMGQ